MGIRDFVLRGGRRLQPAFQFAIATFVVELAATLYLFLTISTKVRFQGFLSADNIVGFWVIGYFFFRVFLIHLSLGIILRIFEEIFSIQRRKTLYFCLLAYAYLFIAIKFPQNYDEFPQLSVALRDLRLFDHVWFLWLPLLGITAVTLSSFLKARQESMTDHRSTTANRGLAWGRAIVGVAALVYYFGWVQVLVPSKVETKPSVSVTPERPHIVLVTIDSLKGDTPLESFPDISPELKEFLADSVQFQHVVSPLPQTHAALTSLLSAKTPPLTGVRTNLSERGLDSEALFKGTPIDQIRTAGYNVRVLQDTSEYAHFNESNILPSIQSPDHSIANILISTFFKNRIVFGLFNNSLGYLLLPELQQNTSFNYSYDLPSFTGRVVQELSSINEQKQPQFLLIHTCAIHWPGALPYPYYPQDSFPKHSVTPFSYTSKFRGLSLEEMTRESWTNQVRFNQKIYKSAIDMTVKEFLNPVFEQIKKSGLDKNSVVVLLSDHGEDLWSPDTKFPKVKSVQHGGSLLFGAKAEFSFLRMKAPGQSARRVAGTVGLIDLLPTVMDFVGLRSENTEGRSLKAELNSGLKDQSYYSETGLWPFGNFAGQFVANPATDLGPIFKVDPKQWKLFINPEMLPGIVQQKQRTIIRDNSKYIIYPTNYGYQEFLCDLNSDPDCLHNRMRTDTKLASELRTRMLGYLRLDTQSGLLKPGACSKFLNSTGQEPILKDIGKFQWQYYFQSLECLREYHDYPYAAAMMDQLMDSEFSSAYLKSQILKTSLDMCGLSKVYSLGKMPAHLRAHLALEHIATAERLAFPLSTARCLMSLGDQAALKAILSKIKKRGSTAESAVRAGDETQDDTKKLQANNQDEWKALQAVLSLVPSAKGDLTRLHEAMDTYFTIERNYNLSDEMEPFLMEALKTPLSSRSDDSLVYIARDLANSSEQSLGISVFNFFIWQIDQVTATSRTVASASSIEVDDWRPSPLEDRPKQRRLEEVARALHKVEAYLCGKKSPYCAEISKLESSP